MAVISWGKPRIKIGKYQANGNAPSSWTEVPTPVEGSTELSVSKGDKKEAKIEGGEAEAVRYGANTYELLFSVRDAKDRTPFVTDVDGVIEGEYAIVLQPEDPKANGIQIDKCVLSAEVSYSSEEGIVRKYTASVLKPKTGSQVKFKVINIDAPSID